MNLTDTWGPNFKHQGHCFERKLTQLNISQPPCTPLYVGEGLKYSRLMISSLHTPGYVYHIVHNNKVHRLLTIVRGEDKVSSVVTQSTMVGLILSHRAIFSYTYT